MTAAMLALVGLPGSGKTSVGAELALRLGWDLIDLDAEVAAAAGRPVHEILRDSGERAFRRLELTALEQALRSDRPSVIACGGGLIAEDTARGLLLRDTRVVWLDAPDAVLVERLGNGASRPLLDGDPAARIPEVRRQRTGAYATAHLRILSSAPVGEIAARIATTVRQSVRVPLGARSYDVEVRAGALDDVALHVPAGAAHIALVADRAVAAPARNLATSLRRAGWKVTVITRDGGEAIKTWAAAGRLLERLNRAGIRRGDCVIAMGGGTLGDVVGFAAAVHLRGVAWLNIPTTFLAMVDSAIGGKTGVNLPGGKNLAGAIWQPRAVVCDTDLLSSLPERAHRAAFAEIIKYSMVCDDSVLVDLLDSHLEVLLQRDSEVSASVVRRCVALKAAVVGADEREAGLRAVLNYGHTVGHALEAAGGYGEAVNHGEAVAAGMRVAGLLSIRHLGCPPGDVAWQNAMLARSGLGTVPPLDVAAVIRRLNADKKTVGDRLRWVLIEARGTPRFGQVVPEQEVAAAITEVLAA
jgi:shikimate kinase/3-dehydroquinate synthase